MSESKVNDYYLKYCEIIQKYIKYRKKNIPLCAAETPVSDFVSSGLDIIFHDRYIKGSVLNFDVNETFIGSEFIFEIYKEITKLSQILFNASFADARTLSGMNALTTVLMALVKRNDKILILPSDAGGHESFPIICKRLGIEMTEIPFNYNTYDIDINKTNELLETGDYKFILLAPSDIIFPYAIEKLVLKDTILIFDVTQVLGLIATNLFDNPLTYIKNSILLGGTHKTLPGPTSGLILTNNNELAKKIDLEISPNYIRNPQPNQVASVLLTLIEFIEHGNIYMQKTIANANILGHYLEQEGFNISKRNNEYTQTHQLFFKTTSEEMNNIYKNAVKYSITLNKKTKQLYNGSGIRIGVQEITRYSWSEQDLLYIAKLFKEIKKSNPSEEYIKSILSILTKPKEMQYTANNLL